MNKVTIILSIFLGIFLIGSITFGFMWSAASSDLDEANAANTLLEQENNTLQGNIDELNEVFPPRDFSSYTELVSWLQTDDVSEGPAPTNLEEWYSNALKVQEHAFNDGFIVSVDYDYYADYDEIRVWCVTVINSYLFYWDPETDDVQEDFSLGAVR